MARVEPRAICCFYDLEDHVYNNSDARASSITLSRLPSSVVPFRPRSLTVGGFSITQIHGESANTSWGYIADTRASVINFHPRWRVVEHPLRHRRPNPSLFIPSRCFRARARKFVQQRRRRGDAGRGIVSGEYTRAVAAKISFRFPSCSATYCDPCLHAGALD